MPEDPSALTISAPARYVALQSIAFGTLGEIAVPVSPASPLPVTTTTAAASSTAVTGSTAASATSAAFTPQLGRPIMLSLSGTWTGAAQLLRSIDGGATKLPLTIGGQPWASFTANAQEPVWTENEAGATFYLAITLATGTLTYRIAQ